MNQSDFDKIVRSLPCPDSVNYEVHRVPLLWRSRVYIEFEKKRYVMTIGTEVTCVTMWVLRSVDKK